MKVEIDEQLIKDINLLISWYQGRQVDRCENVERWVDDIEENKLGNNNK